MEDNKKFLIVGLGNAEAQYAGTRHNIGFEVVNALAKSLGVTFTTDRYAYVAKAKLKGKSIVLVMPTTYMNLSGKAVRYWMDAEKVSENNVMVVCDDIDLPVGTLRMKPKGGGGSHNGLNNIIELLGNQNFPRLRFGIGKNYPQGMQVEYVLGKFFPEERALIDERIEKAAAALQSFILSGLQHTMNACNQS